MVELTATTTLSFVSSQLLGVSAFWGQGVAESENGAMAGVYVTAAMYEGCDSLGLLHAQVLLRSLQNHPLESHSK